MLWKYRNKINCSQNFSFPVHMTKLFTSGLFKSSQKSAISGTYWAEQIPCELRKVTDPVTLPRWSLWQSVCNTCSTLPLLQCGWLVTVVFTAIFCWHWQELSLPWHNLPYDDDEHSVKKKPKQTPTENNTPYLAAKKKSLRPLSWKPSSNLKLKTALNTTHAAVIDFLLGTST